MESSEILKRQILEVVDNQLKSGNPPETSQTLTRLKQMGYSNGDAKMDRRPWTVDCGLSTVDRRPWTIDQQPITEGSTIVEHTPRPEDPISAYAPRCSAISHRRPQRQLRETLRKRRSFQFLYSLVIDNRSLITDYYEDDRGPWTVDRGPSTVDRGPSTVDHRPTTEWWPRTVD